MQQLDTPFLFISIGKNLATWAHLASGVKYSFYSGWSCANKTVLLRKKGKMYFQ